MRKRQRQRYKRDRNENIETMHRCILSCVLCVDKEDEMSVNTNTSHIRTHTHANIPSIKCIETDVKKKWKARHERKCLLPVHIITY